ncbi:unnamed protein product, partial [Polarella glacialis]
ISTNSFLSPERGFDAADTGTAWIGTCGYSSLSKSAESACTGGDWIGVLLTRPATVRCVQLSQGRPDFTVESVSLELWSGPLPPLEPNNNKDITTATTTTTTTTLTTKPRAESPGSSNTSSNSSSSNNNTSANDNKDSTSNSNMSSTARQLRAHGGGQWWRVRSWAGLAVAKGNEASDARVKVSFLRLECDVGLPVGPHVIHDCSTGKQPWDTCVAQCELGYTGPLSTFLCQQDYSFSGNVPLCAANSCSQGIPSQPGETCTAVCALGFVGTALAYECFPEIKNKKVGLLPACESMADVSEKVA